MKTKIASLMLILSSLSSYSAQAASTQKMVTALQNANNKMAWCQLRRSRSSDVEGFSKTTLNVTHPEKSVVYLINYQLNKPGGTSFDALSTDFLGSIAADEINLNESSMGTNTIYKLAWISGTRSEITVEIDNKGNLVNLETVSDDKKITCLGFIW